MLDEPSVVRPAFTDIRFSLLRSGVSNSVAHPCVRPTSAAQRCAATLHHSWLAATQPVRFTAQSCFVRGPARTSLVRALATG